MNDSLSTEAKNILDDMHRYYNMMEKESKAAHLFHRLSQEDRNFIEKTYSCQPDTLKSMFTAYAEHCHENETFQDFSKRYVILMNQGMEIIHARSPCLGAWKHTPNDEYSQRVKNQNSSFSGHHCTGVNCTDPHHPKTDTRGMILALPPDYDSGIESDCASDADCKAPEEPKIKPSRLIMGLLQRFDPPKPIGRVGFFDLSKYNGG